MKIIIKKFNNLAKNTIFKVQNKTNNNFKISSFNKYLITFIGLIFIYVFYLLIPLLYEKSWVQNNIESKLLNEFKIALSTSAHISYRILPAPHFLIKDSKILVDKDEKPKSIGEIKNFKVFLSQLNFFNKEEMNIKKIIIDNANFTLLRTDIKLLNKVRNNKFSSKKIKINNSNIFIKDNLDEIISIIKINEATLFFDNEKLLNLLNLNGEAFNIPFVFNFMNNGDLTGNEKINFIVDSIRLNILNKSVIKKNNPIVKKNIISLSNSKLITKYAIKDKLINFVSEDSRIGNSKINYSGELSINPFDLNLNINLGNYKISQLFKPNIILIEFIKSGLLFNDNISANISIITNSNLQKEIFNDVKINFNIINGKINFNKTRFVNSNIASLELNNSNLSIENNSLILSTDILFEVKNSDGLFSLLNTSKRSRKYFKNILINLDYDFLSNQIKFNKIKIDNSEVSDQLLNIIQGFNDNNFNNFIKSRRLINEILKAYEG